MQYGIFGQVRVYPYKLADERAFAFIVSKKRLSKLAVHRNRARRRLMTNVQSSVDLFPKGKRCVF
ncbi:hypothetical protein DM01DRAFT_300338 [Hesseltinella vesiculosa]|uniref:Uncharacterized protein n=1 Tax=Hesseltinella vesiculosa TaxID=101127 RepID=A0A1X2GJV3_9FUNG|nr:hypothetical protein DM01DRAFT_300338 [Hesseltinella vesiculosa]